MGSARIYEVLARKEREDPLMHIGTVRATTLDFARVYARTIYDEENWVEMLVVDRDDLVSVIELEPLVAPEEVST